MGIFDFLKRKKKNAPLTDEQILDALWHKWTKNETQSPLTEIMEIISNIGACGHADFFDFCKKEPHLQRDLDVALPLLPEVIKDNILKAKAVFDSTTEEEKGDDFLDEFDDVFYENEDLIDSFLLSFIKK